MTSVGEDMKKSESSQIAGGNVNSTAALKNSLAIPQRLNVELPDG